MPPIILEVKVLLGLIAVLISFIAYWAYIKDILAARIKPHAYSWLVWSCLGGIAFFAQILHGAGPGAWVNGVVMVISFIIFILAINRGETRITLLDKISLGGAFGALAVWLATNNPLWSVILITIIDFLGFLPTFRKSYHKPHQESTTMFALSGIKYLFSLGALGEYTLITTIYPASLVLMNMMMVSWLICRKKKVETESTRR